MANKKFLNPINLVNLSSDPSTASEGDIYYNTTDDVVKVYSNGSWAPVVAGNPDYITFDTTPETSSSDQGTLSWNTLDGTLDLKLSSDVTLQVGQEQHVRVHNATGSTIPNGTVVYVNGASDEHGHISVAPYIADGSVNVFNVMGLTTAAILDDADGYVTLSGLVRGLNTSSYTAGQSVFASDTVPGGLTTTQPISPSETVSLGVVTVSDETEGIIFVQIDTGATADLVTYNHTASLLQATNVAAALDELAYTKADINALSSSLVVYPTSVESNISGYYRMVQSIDDTDYNDTAVNISTGDLNGTGSAYLISSLVADANIFVGTPGSINVTTIGNIRKTSGNANAYSEFFFRVYKRTSGGTETLLGSSSTTGAVNPPVLNSYEQFSASGNFLISNFTATDRLVIKYYSNILDDGTQSYEFQFGGTEPVRTLLPVPISVTPASNASGTIVDTSSFSGVLSGADSTVQAALNTIDDIVEIPDQTGHNGEFLKTTGSALEWAAVDLSSKQDVVSGVSSTEIGYLDGVTSAIQTQIDGKSSTSHNHTIDSLSNVVITGTPTDGQAIVWDISTSKWINETVSGGSGNTVTVGSTAPTSPNIGDGWYDNTDGSYYVYDGTYWVEVNGVVGGTTDSIQLTVYNNTGSSIPALSPVYYVEDTVNGINVDVADSNSTLDPNKLPAIGITKSSISNGSSGNIVTYGKITGIDTTDFNSNDSLFVASGGGLTSSRPTGTANVQEVGKVLVGESSSNGEIIVYNTGRKNDIPNLAEGKVWLGNVTSYPVATTIDTSIVPEGSSGPYYFTDARARTALSADLGGTNGGIRIIAPSNTSDATLSNDSATHQVIVKSSGNGTDVKGTLSVTASPSISDPGNLNVAGYIDSAGSITGSSIIKDGGTSSEFLKADGSVDTSTYLTTETDPVFIASEAYNITSTDTSNWDTAYGWGDHASAGYASDSHNHSLDSLSNVVITGTPTDGQAIVWDTTTSKWVNETVSAGASQVFEGFHYELTTTDSTPGPGYIYIDNDTDPGYPTLKINHRDKDDTDLSGTVLGPLVGGSMTLILTNRSTGTQYPIYISGPMSSLYSGGESFFNLANGYIESSTPPVGQYSVAIYGTNPLYTILTNAGISGSAGLIRRTGYTTFELDTSTYLTSYTETDTLETVTDRGASSSNAISITNTTASTSTSTGALVVSGGLGVGQDVWIEGDLHVAGTTVTENTKTVATSDNLIYLNAAHDSIITNAVGDGTYVTYTADNDYTPGMDIRVTGMNPSGYNIATADELTVYSATSTQFVVAKTTTGTFVSGGTAHAKEEVNPDLGFAGGYYDAGYAHAGLFRDASDGIFKFFQGYTPEPDEAVNIDTTHASFALANIAVGDLSVNGGDITSSASTVNLFDGFQTINIGNTPDNVSGTQAINIGSDRIYPQINIGNSPIAIGGNINIGGGYITSNVAVTISGRVSFPRGFTSTYTEIEDLSLTNPLSYSYGGTGLTTLGTAGQVLKVNATEDGLEWGTGGGGSSFTDSAGLAALLSDETGTGLVVFNDTPTLTSPAISGGTINNASIGATTASTGRFTSVNLNGVALMEASTGTTSATSTFNTTVYSSAEFIVYASTASGNYVSKVLMLARGTATPVITEYAILTQGTAPSVTITPSYSAPNAVLTVGVTSGTNIEIIATEVSI